MNRGMIAVAAILTVIAVVGFVSYSAETSAANQICTSWCSLPEYGRDVATANASFVVATLAGFLCAVFWIVTLRDRFQ
jgi:hypothetical protein